ncbi:transcriptional activator of acetoin/glycerol metabolism [Burkholderiales bacterium JOSHI_001]|nr:transcriptional activator of acetoin/glycerol metabolism [Burkholderiales bacterium JOSHI_001]
MRPEPSPYVGYQKDIRAVRHLWERFNAGLLDANERRPAYHQLLLADWQRCSALGVDVAMATGRRLDSGDFHQRRNAEQLLLQTSVPLIQDVGHFLVDVPGILILTERSGTVLHISGDPLVKERAASLSGIVEGSQWNEASAGTNGVGSALTRREPVHVFASEHFCEGWHTWSCAAAPIFDTDGQTVLGIIDFTTVETDFRDQALGLAVSLANTIQARMALHRELERRRVLTAFGDAARHYPHDDLLALDHAGRPLAHSPNERCRLLAQRWGQFGAEGPPPVRQRIEVTAPGSSAPIGAIVLLAKPAGYQRVFRSDAAPPLPGLAAATAAPEPATVGRFGDFITADADTRHMLGDLQRIAQADVAMLITGETGTGKELLARHVHALSPRAAQPYLAVNCGAISEALLESTFFGYVKGAFSGADPRGRAGYFESAGAGTLFLDEVGELPPAMQAALLRVLEDGSFQRVGSCQTQHARCRIIAATHQPLEQMIAQGRFRQDLFFRLKVVQRHISALRERPGDIPLLARQFAQAMQNKHGLTGVHISPEAMDLLLHYRWPGNARELRNAIEAALLCCDGHISPASLPPELRGGGSLDPNALAPQGLASVRDFERQLIIGLLGKHRNIRQVAQVLGVARSTLYRKFAELHIHQADFVHAGVQGEGEH